MKASQIETGKTYTAKVSDRIVKVTVIRIHERYDSFSGRTSKRYECKSLATGRTILVKSAQRFRSEVSA